MSKLYDVSYPILTKEGEKPKWVTCGAVIQTAKGPRLKLDVVPLECNGWFHLFEPRPKEERPQQQKPAAAEFEDDSSLPF